MSPPEGNQPIAGLSQKIDLSPAELGYFQSAGIRSVEGAHDVLVANLNAGKLAAGVADSARQSALVETLKPLLSDAYRQASKQRLPIASGAAAPSVKALADSSLPLTYAAFGPLPGDRLDGSEPVDLIKARYNKWIPENQGIVRQTCVAFAATACLELVEAAAGPAFTLLSPEYLYWHMRTHGWPEPLPPGWDAGGTKLQYASIVLGAAGVCTLSTCPYYEVLGPGAPIEGSPPPSGADAEAGAHRAQGAVVYRDPGTQGNRLGSARLVYDRLKQGRPVAVSVPILARTAGSQDTNWNSPAAWGSGQVARPPDWVTATAPGGGSPGHAVCIVGFQPDKTEPTGGWFIFRNSRGRDWANNIDLYATAPPVVPGPGYGALPATYIERDVWEIYSP
jgi:hypothetical protein